MKRWALTTDEGTGIVGGVRRRIRIEEVRLQASTLDHSTTRWATQSVAYWREIDEAHLATGSGRRWHRLGASPRQDVLNLLEQKTSDLDLAPVREAEPGELPHPLADFVGQWVTETSLFVPMGLSLGFDGGRPLPGVGRYVQPPDRLTFQERPSITVVSGETLDDQNDGFPAAMFGLLAATLVSVDDYLDAGLRLDFSNGSDVCLPLIGTSPYESVTFRAYGEMVSIDTPVSPFWVPRQDRNWVETTDPIWAVDERRDDL